MQYGLHSTLVKFVVNSDNSTCKPYLHPKTKKELHRMLHLMSKANFVIHWNIQTIFCKGKNDNNKP